MKKKIKNIIKFLNKKKSKYIISNIISIILLVIVIRFFINFINLINNGNCFIYILSGFISFCLLLISLVMFIPFISNKFYKKYKTYSFKYYICRIFFIILSFIILILGKNYSLKHYPYLGEWKNEYSSININTKYIYYNYNRIYFNTEYSVKKTKDGYLFEFIDYSVFRKVKFKYKDGVLCKMVNDTCNLKYYKNK